MVASWGVRARPRSWILPGQDGGGGARHLHHFEAAVDVVGGVGMVVVDVDFHFAGKRGFGELADAGGLPGVHQDEALDLLRRHVAAPGEIQEIETGANVKVPQVTLLGTREDLDGARIKLLGRHHGGHGVEVGVQVGGDHLQGAGRGGRLAVIILALIVIALVH